MNLTPLTDQPILAYGIALGIGLLIGAERERRKGIGPTRSAMGIRTFSTTSLLGAVSLTLGGSTLLAVMALAVAGLTAMAFRLSHEQDPGLTTEVALLLTLLLGGLAMRQPALASGLAVILTILLTARIFLHRFVSTILSETELNDALILAAAALVLLPLAPDQYMGPFNALNPRTIWKIVILIMSISATGYISLRVMGPRSLREIGGEFPRRVCAVRLQNILHGPLAGQLVIRDIINFPVSLGLRFGFDGGCAGRGGDVLVHGARAEQSCQDQTSNDFGC